MNSAIATAPVSNAVAPVVTAPVIVITPATQEQVDAFCIAILNGTPTREILPASITDLKVSGGITKEQLAQIKQARKDHEFGAEDNRAALFRLVKSRRLKRVRFNADGKVMGMGFGDYAKK